MRDEDVSNELGGLHMLRWEVNTGGHRPKVRWKQAYWKDRWGPNLTIKLRIITHLAGVRIEMICGFASCDI
jgi:hypothetical protein